MPTYIALLRAVNVGGTGKLPMAQLRAICINAGFAEVRTYIASGNVVFRSEATADTVQRTLESALHSYAAKPIAVLLRSAAELAKVLSDNPFPNAPANRCIAIFLNQPPSGDAPNAVTGRNGEEIALGKREIYVHYVEGMANSKLNIPAAKSGTARNMNTVAKLVQMSSSAGD